jgi:tetratricopeptide (TPR) repeat protein
MNRILALLFFFFAISCFTQLHAQDGQGYVDIADSLYKNQGYQLAADNYSKAMPFYKNDNKFLSKLYDKRNKCERRLKLYPQAIADANTALSLDPENGVAYWDLGSTYGDSGNHKLSMENYTKAMSLYQDDAKSLSKLCDNRAYEELDSGLYKDVITDDSLAISLNEENGNAYLQRGLAFTKLGDFKNTVDNYTNAISHETDDNKLADLYNKRGIGEYELKN